MKTNSYANNNEDFYGTLTQCPNCNRDVSKFAPYCSWCGYQVYEDYEIVTDNCLWEEAEQ